MFNVNNPYEGQNSGHISVLRVRPGKPICGTLVGSPIKSWVHFHAGKSLPCVKGIGNDCPLCDMESPRRYYAWYPIKGQSGQLALLELTAAAEEELVSLMRDCEENELVRVKAFRGDARRNAPIRIKIDPLPVEREVWVSWWKTIPAAERFQEVLLTLWGVPHPKPKEELESWLVRVGKNISNRL